MKIIEKLMDAKSGTSEEKWFDLLADKIIEYENIHYPIGNEKE